MSGPKTGSGPPDTGRIPDADYDREKLERCRNMKRSLVVTLVGMAMTLLLLSLGMKVLVTLSPDWRALVRQVPRGHESLWVSFWHYFESVIAFVCIPTALLVGFLVGLFSSKYKLFCAVIATSPAWMPLLGMTLEGALVGMLIASTAVFGAWLSKRAVRTSRLGQRP